MSALSNTGITPATTAQLPASVRNGTPQDQKAYETALGFEQMLVNELTTELVKTASISGTGDGSSDGTDGSGDGTSNGLMGGSDPATTMYAQMLPQALTDGLMSTGGTGIAQQLFSALDPTFGSKK